MNSKLYERKINEYLDLGINVSVELIYGGSLDGVISASDHICIVLDEGKNEVVVMRHAIESIVPIFTGERR